MSPIASGRSPESSGDGLRPRLRAARDRGGRADGDGERLRAATSRSCSSASSRATIATRIGTGASGHGGDHLLPVFVSSSLTVPVLGGRGALGTWQSVVIVDPNRENDERTVRLSFVAGGAPALEVLAGRVVLRGVGRLDDTACTSRSRSRTSPRRPARPRGPPTAGTGPGRPPWPRGRRGRPGCTSPQDEPLRGGHRRRGDQQAAGGRPLAVVG